MPASVNVRARACLYVCEYNYVPTLAHEYAQASVCKFMCVRVHACLVCE